MMEGAVASQRYQNLTRMKQVNDLFGGQRVVCELEIAGEVQDWLEGCDWGKLCSYLVDREDKEVRMLWLTEFVFLSKWLYDGPPGMEPKYIDDLDLINEEAEVTALCLEFEPLDQCRLYVVDRHPFKRLNESPLQLRRLCNISLDGGSLTARQCSALATFDGYLSLVGCTLVDGGVQLGKALQTNKGPKHLVVPVPPRFSPNGWKEFADALRHNLGMRTLEFYECSVDVSSANFDWKSCFCGISCNQTLQELRFHNFFFNDDTWNHLLGTIRSHSTIKKLGLYLSFRHPMVGLEKLEPRMQSLADALSSNTAMTQVGIHGWEISGRGGDSGEKIVALFDNLQLVLEVNKYRPRISRISGALVRRKSTTFWTGVLGQAAVTLHDKPDVLNHLLKENVQTISQQHSRAQRSLSASARASFKNMLLNLSWRRKRRSLV